MNRFILTIALCILQLYIHELKAQVTAIRAGHVIMPSTGKMLDNQILLIENGKIKRIENDYGNVEADSIIDLSSSWVTPGLMDCHVHLTSNMSYRHFDYIQRYADESDAFRVLRGVHNASLLLNGGFTTVKEIGNDGNYATADLIKAIKKGWVEGPNIQYAGKIIAPYGGQSAGISYQYEGLWEREFIDADSQEEMRKAIRQNIYFGATTIKLVTGDQKYFYSQEDIAFAVKEAKQAGLKVSIHANSGEHAKNAILGGAASIEHGFFLDETLLKLMKEKGTFLVGTDFYLSNWAAYGMDSDQANFMYKATLNRLKLAYSMGVKMAFGTDIVIDIEGKNRLETNLEVLKTWKEAEIEPMYVLKCMTSNAAELLGIDASVGKLQENYTADIVAFEENPLDDIENIKSIHFVMKKGNVVRDK